MRPPLQTALGRSLQDTLCGDMGWVMAVFPSMGVGRGVAPLVSRSSPDGWGIASSLKHKLCQAHLVLWRHQPELEFSSQHFLVMLLGTGGDTHVTLVIKDSRSLQPLLILPEVKCHFLPVLPLSRGLVKPPAHFLGLRIKGLRGLSRRKLWRPGRVKAPPLLSQMPPTGFGFQSSPSQPRQIPVLSMPLSLPRIIWRASALSILTQATPRPF